MPYEVKPHSDRIHTQFQALLNPNKAKELEENKDTIYGILLPEGILAYYNNSWMNFAKENTKNFESFRQSFQIGTPITYVVPNVLEGLYSRLYKNALQKQKTQRIFYECSSPEEYRQFEMKIEPLSESAILIRNSLRNSYKHNPEENTPYPPDLTRYTSKDQIIQQCSNCRCVQPEPPVFKWDWVPEWVKEPPKNVTHGLCPRCEKLLDDF